MQLLSSLRVKNGNKSFLVAILIIIDLYTQGIGCTVIWMYMFHIGLKSEVVDILHIVTISKHGNI